MATDARRKLAEEVTKQLADSGKIIEGGWRGLEVWLGMETASEIQRREMRFAFFAGAQHLFSSIMNILEPGEEPTANDMRRLDLIAAELDGFAEEMRLRKQGKG